MPPESEQLPQPVRIKECKTPRALSNPIPHQEDITRKIISQNFASHLGRHHQQNLKDKSTLPSHIERKTPASFPLELSSSSALTGESQMLESWACGQKGQTPTWFTSTAFAPVADMSLHLHFEHAPFRPEPAHSTSPAALPTRGTAWRPKKP
jgi:hypothetical protein